MKNSKMYKIKFPIITFSILGFIVVSIGYIQFSFDAAKSILEKAPNSNFALLFNTINKFWADSLFFSVGLAGVAHIISTL